MVSESDSLPDRIVTYLRSEAPHPLRASELGRALDVRPAERKLFRRALKRLEAEGMVYRLRGARYAAPERIRLITGVVRGSRRGHGFVAPEEGEDELFIPPGRLHGAMDGDRVVARVEGKGRSGRPEGRVIRILERGRTTVVGRFIPGESKRSPVGFVAPDDPSIRRDVIVRIEPGNLPATGDIVVVSVTDWGDEQRAAVGEIERVLGCPGEPGVDVLAIIHGHELPVEAPAEVLEQAEQLSRRGVRPTDLRGREDLRSVLTFTIDPPDAKDHDDALSVSPAGEGVWEVGVHIADVSFYVRPNTVLDEDARQRGTSVYLVDRTIPMLPEALSSDLCSLVPDVDRLTLSVFLTVTADGAVCSHRLVQSVIRSRHRLAYDGVQAVFEGGAAIDDETDAALFGLRDVSRALRARRRARGSLDFDLPEARVFLDEEGAPVDVQRAERWDSHRLVEDLMLAANEAVGARALQHGYPFVYRVHERPDPSRIEQLGDYARALGFAIPFRGDPSPAQLQSLLEQRPASPPGQLLATLVLRSMKQARYHEADLGHFGLATKHYTHFTSPIRRYPDLLVHRLVAAHHLGRGSVDRYDVERVRAIARLASDRERVAAAAERDSTLLKKVQFMERHLGSTFEGTVSDVRPFGFFVLLDPYFIEGLVHVSSLDDDYYRWVEERFLLTGENTGRRFQVGQRVRIQVSRVDTAERRIDFVLAGGRQAPRRGRAAGRRRR